MGYYVARKGTYSKNYRYGSGRGTSKSGFRKGSYSGSGRKSYTKMAPRYAKTSSGSRYNVGGRYGRNAGTGGSKPRSGPPPTVANQVMIQTSNEKVSCLVLSNLYVF